MFAWLQRKELKPTAGIARIGKEGLSERSAAAGVNGDALALEPLPPHPLLSLFPRPALDRLLGNGAVAESKKGTVVFQAGDPCRAIFLILSGRCETRRPAESGVAEVEEVLGPGDLLGARDLLNREPHGASAVVVTHAVLLRIPADELTALFAQDPCVAGRFSQAVTAANITRIDRRSRVRRVVSLLALSSRLQPGAMTRRLAAALHELTHQRVLVIQLSARAPGVSSDFLSVTTPAAGAAFAFARGLRAREDFDEIHLAARAEASDAEAIAPLVGHCGRHYDYVIVEIDPDTPRGVIFEALIQSDLGFVLLQPSMQNLYDFQLLLGGLSDLDPDACAHVKPILLAEESLAAPEMNATLRSLGHPVHSIIRGFPLRDGSASADRRFNLAINRLAREVARCRVGLALSSGSAKGLAHIGVIQVLEENGIEVDCIAGSSMGAYVGAVWAYGLDGEHLEKVARETEGRWGFLRLVDPVIPPRRGFLRTRRVAARLRHTIGDAVFSDLIRPLRVSATRLDTLERVVFSSGGVVPAVEASIAIPGVCVPVTLDGETFIDGGIADPLPVDVLAEMGIERIIAVNVIPTPERIRYWLDARRELNGREPRRAWLSRFAHSHFNYSASGNILDTMMRAINGAQTRVAEASAREADVVLRPLCVETVWHDFTQPRKHVALGRSIAEAQLSEIKALAGGEPHEPEPPLAITPRLAA